MPILERKRRLTQWDIKPPGYENVTAEQAKMSGMFPLPGAPRQQQMDPSRLQAFMNLPTSGSNNTALKPSNARQSKRLFVHNLPVSVTEDGLVQFFNLQLNGLNVTKSSDPCAQANIAEDRSFALVEFKHPSDATLALALDGITMEEHHSEMNGNGNGNGTAAAPKGLEIRRPKDYIVPSADEDAYTEGEISSEVPDTANKLAITSLPPFLTDDQVIELLKAFGELKAFVLVREPDSQESRVSRAKTDFPCGDWLTLTLFPQGIAFCEYADPASTSVAIEGLNGMDLAGNAIKVTRASIGYQQAAGLDMGVNAMSMFAGTTSDGLEESRVLQLLNMVTPEDLIDNDDYEGKKTTTQPTSVFACLGPFANVVVARNLRRCHGRMLQVRQDPGYEDPPSLRRQQAVGRRGQDLFEIRGPRVREEGSAGLGWSQVCRSDGRYHLFRRGMFVVFDIPGKILARMLSSLLLGSLTFHPGQLRRQRVVMG